MTTEIKLKVKQRKCFKLLKEGDESSENHPLITDLYLDKKENPSLKNVHKKKGISRLTKTVVDPLSMDNPLTEDIGIIEKPSTKHNIAIVDHYVEDWKKLRRDSISNFDSSSNLASISIIEGENSARHVTVKEFTEELESKHAAMIDFWKKEDKVEALKIVIQCLKTLTDNSAIEFYPAKVFLIHDLLISFTDLVEKRLKAMDNEMAQEVAKNWFYKVFSIRYL